MKSCFGKPFPCDVCDTCPSRGACFSSQSYSGITLRPIPSKPEPKTSVGGWYLSAGETKRATILVGDLVRAFPALLPPDHWWEWWVDDAGDERFRLLRVNTSTVLVEVSGCSVRGMKRQALVPYLREVIHGRG